jgi:RNA polymerase sigma-70 factor (ECF subfamily)
MKAPMGLSTANLIPTRYSLLSRLQNWEDHESWKDFFNTYWRLIYLVALKSGLTETEAQEVVQETVISVAKGIHKFERNQSKGSFKGWLRNLTRWRIVDQLEKRTPSGRNNQALTAADVEPVDLEEVPDPGRTGIEVMWENEWRTNLFEAAVERVKQQVKEEHYQIFDLYVVRGWPVLKVARTMNVSAGRVYLIKHRIASLIRKEIQLLEKELF